MKVWPNELMIANETKDKRNMFTHKIDTCVLSFQWFVDMLLCFLVIQFFVWFAADS